MRKGHLVLAMALLLALVSAAFYFFDSPDFPRLGSLPYFAVSSLLRMSLAYFLSLLFALSYGYVAATSDGARRFLVPVLDILQSVPILGFFPAAVLFFVDVFPGRPGVEFAAIFLIFTSMAWNMAFGVYESLRTVPKQLVEAADSFGVRGWQRFRNLVLSVCIPKLVYNSVLSWSGGWFFLIASEIISAGSRTYRLPGLGSFLIDATYSGKMALMFAGLLVLVLIILLLELFIWRPLQSWSNKFSYDYAGEKRPGEFMFGAGAIKRFLRFAFEASESAVFFLYSFFQRHGTLRNGIKLFAYLASFSAAGYLSYVLALSAFRLLLDLPPEAYSIPLALLYSFLRLGAAYAICVLWTFPAAVYVVKSKRTSSFLMPAMEVAAAVPASALFPALVVVFVGVGGMDSRAVILTLAGMQWYLLFNLIAGLRSVPREVAEASASFGIKGWLYWRRVLLPAVFPSFVTGSITAWGGGWNSLIIAEYISVKGRSYHVFGIGYLLDKATFESPDPGMVALSVAGMVLFILLLNRIIWQPLYRKALAKYKFD